MKTIKTLIMAFALCLGANAQTVSVADVEALPGETVAFSLDLTGGKADTYISLQFNVAFPATGFATTGDYTVSSAWKNASAVIGDVDSDGHAVVPVSSAEVITGSDVEGLLTVWFTVGSDVAVGEYDVTLSNITFGYGFTDKDVADDVTFKVKVVNAHTVVLDENSTTVPEAAEGVNVRVKRTINAGEWSTICLPFAMSEAQVKAAFGDDVQLGDFTGCEATYDETEENVTALKVNFSNVTAIEANHPYIIKVADAVTEFTVNGVDVTPSDELSVDMDESRQRIGGKWFYFYNSFIGSYVADTELPENSLFLSGSKFWYATENTQHMKAFRGYFDFYDMLSEVANAASRIVMSFSGDNMTGITNIDKENDCRYYNLQGMPVETPVRGMYIRNGKVVIVKQ